MAILTDWMTGGGLSGDPDTNVFQSGLTGDPDTNIINTFPITPDNPIPGGSSDPDDPSAGPIDWFGDTFGPGDDAGGGGPIGGTIWLKAVVAIVGIGAVAWLADSVAEVSTTVLE